MKQNSKAKKQTPKGRPAFTFAGMTNEGVQGCLDAASLTADWILGAMVADAPRLLELYFGADARRRRQWAVERQTKAAVPFFALVGLHEWLCAEVKAAPGGVEQLLSPLALRSGNLGLTAQGREYVRRLAGTSLDLYAFEEVEGDRILVRSLLQADAPPEWILRPCMLPIVYKGDRAGLRLVKGKGLREAALGVYLYAPDDLPGLADRIGQSLRESAALGRPASLDGSLRSLLLIRAWVDGAFSEA